MRITSLISLLFAVVMLPACASFTPHTSENGTKIERDQIAFIKKGKTTRTEVEEKLGQPDSVHLVGEGKRMAIYSYYAVTAPALAIGAAKVSTNKTSLQVNYNQKEIVEDFEYSASKSAEMVDDSLYGGRTRTKVKE